MKARRYLYDFGISPSSLAKVAVKATENAVGNENAWRRATLTAEQVLAAPMVSDPLTQLMFCSPGAGAVALILATLRRVRTLPTPPVYLRSVAFGTRQFGSYDVFSPAIPVELCSTARADAAAAAFESAGVDPYEVDIIQVHFRCER